MWTYDTSVYVIISRWVDCKNIQKSFEVLYEVYHFFVRNVSVQANIFIRGGSVKISISGSKLFNTVSLKKSFIYKALFQTYKHYDFEWLKISLLFKKN